LIMSGEDFVRKIQIGYTIEPFELDLHKFVEKLSKDAEDIDLKALSKYLKKKTSVFECDSESRTIYFASNEEEDSFFRKLLPPFNGIDSLCRFSTMDSAFFLLKDLKQNMCNVSCMNDRSEGIYADKAVFGMAPEIDEKAFAESDNCYILSLLHPKKKDDLTMWRLYGENAKGTCLSYSLKDDLEASRTFKNFYLARVKYGRLEKGEEVHKELDFLRKMHNYNNWSFRFKRWGIWKHFFKSYHFRDEKEIRLLYYDENGQRKDHIWIKNSDSQIVSKMQLFDFDEFPLKLDGIIVGPKCPESRLISRQLNLLSISQQLNLDVTYSKVVVYR